MEHMGSHFNLTFELYQDKNVPSVNKSVSLVNYSDTLVYEIIQNT